MATNGYEMASGLYLLIFDALYGSRILYPPPKLSAYLLINTLLLTIQLSELVARLTGAPTLSIKYSSSLQLC